MKNETTSNNDIMALNFDFMEDQFFKQTPAQLRQIGGMLGVCENFFKYTYRKLEDYAQNIGVHVTSQRVVSTKKRVLIRRILVWHQTPQHITTTSTDHNNTTNDDDVQIIETPIRTHLVVDSEDESENPLLWCVVCGVKQRNTVYNDCHHFVCCSRCADKCGLKCPVCRTVNKTKQTVFIC